MTLAQTHCFTYLTLILLLTTGAQLTAQSPTLQIQGKSMGTNHETGEALLATTPYPTAIITHNTGKPLIDLWAYRFDPTDGTIIDSTLLGQRPEKYGITNAHLTKDQGFVIVGRQVGGSTEVQWYTPQLKPTHQHQFSLAKGKIPRSWWIEDRGLLVAIENSKNDSSGFTLHQISPQGKKGWSKQFQIGGKLVPYDFTAATEGFLMLGSRRDSALIQRFNLSGEIVWSRTYADTPRPIPDQTLPIPSIKYGAFHHFWETEGSLEVIGTYLDLGPQLRISFDENFNVVADSLLLGSYQEDFTGNSELIRSHPISLIHHTQETIILDEANPEQPVTSIRAAWRKKDGWRQKDAWLANSGNYFITIATRTYENKDQDALLTAISVSHQDTIWQRSVGRASIVNDHYPINAGTDKQGNLYEVYLSRSFKTSVSDTLWLHNPESVTSSKRLLSLINHPRKKATEAVITAKGLVVTLTAKSDTTGWLTVHNSEGKVQAKTTVNWRSTYQTRRSLYAAPSGMLAVYSGTPRLKLDLTKMVKEGKTFGDLLNTPLELQIVTPDLSTILRDTIPYFTCGKLESQVFLPGGDIMMAGRCGKPYQNILVRYSLANRKEQFVKSLPVPPAESSRIAGIASAKKGKMLYALTVVQDTTEKYQLYLHTLDTDGNSKNRLLLRESNQYPLGCLLSSDNKNHALVGYTDIVLPGTQRRAETLRAMLIKGGLTIKDYPTEIQVQKSQLYGYNSYHVKQQTWSLYGLITNRLSKQDHTFLWTKTW